MYTCVTKHFYKDCVEWYSGYISTQDMSRPTTDSNRKPKYDIYDIRPVFDPKMYMENKTYLNDIFYKNLGWLWKIERVAYIITTFKILDSISYIYQKYQIS